MLLKIIYALICVAVMGLTPLYVKAQRDGACPKSLLLKMTAATGYLLTGILGMYMKSNFTPFAFILLGALIFSWLGDLFLHLWQHKAFKAIGFLGFLTAHFFFIAAFLNGIEYYAPGTSFFSVPEIIAVIGFDVFFIVFSLIIGTNIKSLVCIPLLVYSTVITTMLCKAGVLAVSYYNAVGADALKGAVCLIAGAALFVMSDFSIAVLMFNKKHKKNYKLKMFNMITYYAAELLLSSSMLFIITARG